MNDFATTLPMADMVGYSVTTAFLFRYLVFIDMVGCALLVFHNVYLGLYKVCCCKQRPFRITAFMCLALFFLQLVVSIARIKFSYSPSFAIPKPFDAFLNFIWSPLMTIPLVWCLQCYLANFCQAQRGASDVVDYKPNWILVVGALGIGFVSSYTLNGLFHAFGFFHTDDFILIPFALIALVSGIAEVILSKNKEGRVSLVSYGFLWFVGAWISFLWLFVKVL